MRLLKALFIISFSLFCLPSFAEELLSIKPSATLSVAKLKDQFDKEHTLLPSTKWLIFAHDMQSSSLVKKAFEKQTTDTLSKANIQYYADISAMPGLISRFVAIPRMKKQSYTIILDREGKVLKSLPKEEDKVTVIELNNFKIVNIAKLTDAEELKRKIFN